MYSRCGSGMHPCEWSSLLLWCLCTVLGLCQYKIMRNKLQTCCFASTLKWERNNSYALCNNQVCQQLYSYMLQHFNWQIKKESVCIDYISGGVINKTITIILCLGDNKPWCMAVHTLSMRLCISFSIQLYSCYCFPAFLVMLWIHFHYFLLVSVISFLCVIPFLNTYFEFNFVHLILKIFPLKLSKEEFQPHPE